MPSDVGGRSLMKSLVHIYKSSVIVFSLLPVVCVPQQIFITLFQARASGQFFSRSAENLLRPDGGNEIWQRRARQIASVPSTDRIYMKRWQCDVLFYCACAAAQHTHTILLLSARCGRKMARRSGIDQLPASASNRSVRHQSRSRFSHRLKMDDGFAINCAWTFAQHTHRVSYIMCGVFQQRINCTRWWSNPSPFIGKSQTPFVERGVKPE